MSGLTHAVGSDLETTLAVVENEDCGLSYQG